MAGSSGAGVEAHADYGGPGVKATCGYGHAITGEVLTSDNGSSCGVFGKSRGQLLQGAAGVKGDGGTHAPGLRGDGKNAPGVMGESTNDAGVLGKNTKEGPGGSFEGVKGPGVRGTSTASWGGEFESSGRGQIRLVPHSVEFAAGDQGAPYPKLPTVGSPGEMITVLHEDGTCSLWLCVKPFTLTKMEGGMPFPLAAGWAPVQLGAAIMGQG
ncbi:hypothetical protein ACODT3_32845 [Streptomyces sp. 4.24]|uniref:hypothetical protein n=1 Tax=Streptomyces tritrimontium TaxID=3406573 RepID=UPI003BB6B4EF